MSDVFLKQFLMISDFKTILFIVIYLLLALFIFKLPKKRFSFSSKVIMGTIFGLIIGFSIQAVSGFNSSPMSLTFVSETSMWYSLIGNGFINLIRMLVIPLVMISIIRVIIYMEQEVNVNKLIRRGIITTMGMVVVASIVGLTLGMLFQLGAGIQKVSGTNGIREVVPIVTTLQNLIPSNPIEAMVNNNIVGIVIFATFIAFAARLMNRKYPEVMKVFYDLINALHKIIISIAMSIIKGMPYAVLALLANTIAQRGLSSIMEVGKFIIVLYLACAIQFLIQLFALTLFKVNPIIYVKKSYSLLLLAFTSRSSLGVLPATLTTLTNDLGVSNGTANFVASFNTTAGMQGCAGVFPAMLIVYVANITQTPIDISFLMMVVIVVSIGSIGIAGIPGTSTMAASLSISGVGLGSAFASITPILAVDPIIDMIRTMLNVSGSLTNSIMVDRQLKQMDMNQFNK
ncbi:MAG: cation:dicarboxylase symporter family transporter [Erysipelotrichaceae bacterium]